MNAEQSAYHQGLINHQTTPLRTGIYVTVYGRPQQRGSKTPQLIRRRGRQIATRKSGAPMIAMRDDNERSKAWMDNVRSACVEQLPSDWQPLTGPLVLEAAFYFARPKSHFGSGRNAGRLRSSAPEFHTQTPDLAKLVRAIEDAMTGIVYADDRAICLYRSVTKCWTTGMERAEIYVEQISDCG